MEALMSYDQSFFFFKMVKWKGQKVKYQQDGITS